MKPTPWHVYIIICNDGTLYTGVTNKLDQRIEAHNCGKGCRYTKFRWPVKLAHKELHPGKIAAMKREAQIKGWDRKRKMALINSGGMKPQ
jgi:putative endonuclease